jgi:hypothetical protein
VTDEHVLVDSGLSLYVRIQLTGDGNEVAFTSTAHTPDTNRMVYVAQLGEGVPDNVPRW